jgi:hypothetical protein
MSSVLGVMRCQQCSFAEANYFLDCSDNSWDVRCPRCGYYECSEPEYDLSGQVRESANHHLGMYPPISVFRAGRALSGTSQF